MFIIKFCIFILYPGFILVLLKFSFLLINCFHDLHIFSVHAFSYAYLNLVNCIRMGSKRLCHCKCFVLFIEGVFYYLAWVIEGGRIGC